MNSLLLKVLIGIGIILLGLILLVAVIYFWPLGSSRLQTSEVKPLSYTQAVNKVAELNKSESEQGVLPECSSALMTHGSKTAKTVVMLHGVTSCPRQFKELGQKFFDAGYNVYIPRVPFHGTSDPKAHGGVTAGGLVEYATTSVNIARGLGDEVGVAGLSGGGLIATWLAEYRPDVSRALVMSPFYEPGLEKAPKWQLKFLNPLYGHHILPDNFVTSGDAFFSYYALANYNILTINLKSNPKDLALKNFALLTTPTDDQIDLDLAVKIPREIAAANPNMKFQEASFPTEWDLDHDFVDPRQPAVDARKAQLYDIFFDAYEGRDIKL